MTAAIDSAYSLEGAGPPLLLIHGIGAARDAWRMVVPHLTDRFSVITYDLRGHGQSPCPNAEFGLAELVADVEQLRCRLEIDSWHLAGHSLGGMIGPAYAREYPDRVRSLGLFSTAAGRTDEDSAKVWNVIKAMEDRGIEKVLGTLTDRWFTDAFIQENQEVVERRLKQVLATRADIFMNVFRIYAATEMLPWLHEIPHPTLIITGEHDGGCNPRLNRQIHAALPNSHLLILDGLKHSILAEAGHKVADAYLRFLGKLDAGYQADRA